MLTRAAVKCESSTSAVADETGFVPPLLPCPWPCPGALRCSAIAKGLNDLNKHVYYEHNDGRSGYTIYPATSIFLRGNDMMIDAAHIKVEVKTEASESEDEEVVTLDDDNDDDDEDEGVEDTEFDSFSETPSSERTFHFTKIDTDLICRYCDKKFNQARSVQRHEQRQHLRYVRPEILAQVGLFPVAEAEAEADPDPPSPEPDWHEPEKRQPSEADELDAEPLEAEELDAQPLEADELDIKPSEADELDIKPSEADELDAEPLEAEELDIQPSEEKDLDPQPSEADELDAEPLEAEDLDPQPLEAEVDLPVSEKRKRRRNVLYAEALYDTSTTSGGGRWKKKAKKVDRGSNGDIARTKKPKERGKAHHRPISSEQ